MARDPRAKIQLPWKPFFISSAVGLLVMFINFPKFTSRIAYQMVEDPALQTALLFPLNSVQSVLTFFIGPAPQALFQNLMAIDFLAFWIFLTALALFALRHRDIRLLGFGIGGLVLGYTALHLISWMAVIVVTVIGVVITIVTWISSVIGAVVTFIGAVVTFIFVHGWWLLLLLGLGFVLYIFKEHLLKILAALGGTAIVGYLLYRFVPPMWHRFMDLVDPVLEFVRMAWTIHIIPILMVLWWVLKWVVLLSIVAVGVFGILVTLGRLVIDQFRAAWVSSVGEKHLAFGTFAIGSALALVILTSVAAPLVANGVNGGWQQSLQILDGFMDTRLASGFLGHIEPTNIFVATMPSSVENFVFTYLTNAQPPIVDGVVFLLTMAFSTMSLIGGLIPAMTKVPIKLTDYFLPREFFAIVFGLLAGIVIVFLQAVSEDE